MMPIAILLGFFGCVFGLAGVCACEMHAGSQNQQGEVALGGEESVTVEIHTETGHIVMQAWIEGEGPYWFVLDTGNQNTTIFADLAGRLGLETEPMGEMGGAGSGSITVHRASDVRVGLGTDGQRAGFVDAVVTVLPDEAMLPPFGDKQISGLLGATLVERFITSIDYAGGLLVLHDRDQYEVPEEASVMEMKIAFGFPYFEGTVVPIINGRASDAIVGSYLLDLGDSMGVGIEFEQAKAAGLVGADDPAQKTVGRARGIDGVEFEMRSAPVKAITMGGMGMDDEVITFSTTPGGGPPIPNLVGFVGSGSFAGSVVTLDYLGGRLILSH
jgi:hypothetical protein